MEFKNQKEYEKYKEYVKNFGMGVPGGIPAGMEWFPEAERDWIAKTNQERLDQLEKQLKNQGKDKGKGSESSDGLRIGTGGTGGDILFDKAGGQTAPQIIDPFKDDKRYSKKGNFKKDALNIYNKYRGEDGAVFIPKIELPDRMKIKAEDQKAINAIDKQFNADGVYKGTDPAKMPSMQDYNKKRRYRRAEKKLQRRLGVGEKGFNATGYSKKFARQFRKEKPSGSGMSTDLRFPAHSLKIPNDGSLRHKADSWLQKGKMYIDTSRTK